MHLTAGAMTETMKMDLEHVLFGCRSRGVERGSRALLRGVRVFSGANEPAAPDETSMDTGTPHGMTVGIVQSSVFFLYHPPRRHRTFTS